MSVRTALIKTETNGCNVHPAEPSSKSVSFTGEDTLVVHEVKTLWADLDEYVFQALKSAKCEMLGDGSWYGEIPGFDGAWGKGADQEICRKNLQEVLYEWLLLKLKDKDHDIPKLGDIDLNVFM